MFTEKQEYDEAVERLAPDTARGDYLNPEQMKLKRNIEIFEAAGGEQKGLAMCYREFLNEPGTAGHSPSIISITATRDMAAWQGKPYLEIGFSISDCSRIINLDFEAETPEGLAQARTKAKVLLEGLRQLDTLLEREGPRLEQAWIAIDAIKEKYKGMTSVELAEED